MRVIRLCVVVLSIFFSSLHADDYNFDKIFDEKSSSSSNVDINLNKINTNTKNKVYETQQELLKVRKKFFPSNERTILSPYAGKDIQNMCLSVSGEYRDLCYNIKNEDLKNSCIGMTKYKDNCYSVKNEDLKNLELQH